MSIHVALHHRTTYAYDRPVTLGPQIVRLRPAPHCRTPVLSYALNVEPAGHFINWQQDPQGNYLARLVFPEPTRRFAVTVDLVADMAVINPFDFFLDPEAESFPFQYDPALSADLAPFRKTSAPGPLLAEWLGRIECRTPQRTVDFLVDLNRRLQQDIGYVIRMEPGVQSFEETLARRKGSCRDTGWLLVNILRHLGFATRFVSGYLVQLKADEKPLEGPEGPEQDFTDLHAWCEVYLPGAGWIGLDPTSGLMAGEGHIPLAATPEPQSAAPVEGMVAKAEVDFSFAMSVARIRETPRTTKPYADETWQRIVALGETIDRDLASDRMGLTMGGEPTFVSVDDMDGPEWNTEALGANKRRIAGNLFRALARRFGNGSLLHYGQGKWYPGEQLPRWALTCFWRKDGEAIWRNPRLIAHEEKPNGATPEVAGRFAQVLAERLQIDPGFALPAFEDTWYYLWRERRLPVNVDPAGSNLKDPLERARLARVFEQGLESVVGHVLPIQREHGRGRRWRSGPWFVRPQRLYLIPGDSPIGYRLPLDSLPWAAPEDQAYFYDPDPLMARMPLPPLDTLRQAAVTRLQSPAANPGEARGRDAGPTNGVPAKGQSAAWITRTAMVFEPRQGHLHVFMPPTEDAEDYLHLIAAVEDTAEELGCPVFVEGYQPPFDPRLSQFSVTPDPGVIEVNIHPSASWREVVDKTEIVYDEARQVRLGAQKFMLDGRHTGTGGGNHVTLGGATPAGSPLLRRPDLLKSLLGYWHNHPSLSYLFSGLFIGPTSQHPRVDEARNDALFELEIAFRQIDSGKDAQPWLVDRLFRNLLVDVTGNTHRAEFCIDKLYTPDSAAGRRGLLELRAFEMPPHPRMSVAQQLLLRGLLASFWRQPYDRKLTRWGTRLHDDFMLPHFVWQDFNEVIDDLRHAGYDVEASWFLPHLEFRFPEIGAIAQRGIELELRHALEPWHVLGEEAATGGTARFVDSSLERLQVKVRGLNDTRHAVACGGYAVPLRATGVPGEYVAGVRYRAWQPPSALHPTIGVHAPLIFDLYDSWTGRSIGGCTYHVAHPGGRNYDRFPVNANEAEARRRVRFAPIGHTQGPIAAPRPLDNPDHPLTLDLRRA
ncbi:transglutaminase family protein [Vineibacter terrae]|uniref:transglutaminase family protein n=1 Tax=Vineibacter terrae TaxID=2586908 RepID=UPI002E300EA1|nr:transglutaminase family protein [Vineibacter terrae]HEX2885326.1 transglutaminase family protein [Vineibacter terrae]